MFVRFYQIIVDKLTKTFKNRSPKGLFKNNVHVFDEFPESPRFLNPAKSSLLFVVTGADTGFFWLGIRIPEEGFDLFSMKKIILLRVGSAETPELPWIRHWLWFLTFVNG